MTVEKIGAKHLATDTVTKFWNNTNLTNIQVAEEVARIAVSQLTDGKSDLDSLANKDDLIKQTWKGINTKIRVNKTQASQLTVSREGGTGAKASHRPMTEEEIQAVQALAPVAPAQTEEPAASQESAPTEEQPAATASKVQLEDEEPVPEEKPSVDVGGFVFYAHVLGSKRTFSGATHSEAFEQARKFLVENRFTKAIIKKNGVIIDVTKIENGDTVEITKQLTAASGQPKLTNNADHAIDLAFSVVL